MRTATDLSTAKIPTAKRSCATTAICAPRATPAAIGECAKARRATATMTTRVQTTRATRAREAASRRRTRPHVTTGCGVTVAIDARGVRAPSTPTRPAQTSATSPRWRVKHVATTSTAERRPSIPGDRVEGLVRRATRRARKPGSVTPRDATQARARSKTRWSRRRACETPTERPAEPPRLVRGCAADSQTHVTRPVPKRAPEPSVDVQRHRVSR